ncbi:MAG TPA: MBL fold metallo-hydrolase [Syntrophomonadaceae bacterium]|nr:MBL fold metallo-hydrolase [Syntrophomonadaceae bacterium]
MNKSRITPSFIAIGVGQGDAFFLDNASTTILIDGGRSTQGFPAQFQKVTERESVDILVCTHNDADHANGILGFLQSGLTCNEVWLPGSWTDRLEDILLHPSKFIEELIFNPPSACQ